jgi:hypothetical protein
MVTVLLAPNANLDSISVHLENARYRVIAGTWQIEPTPPMGRGIQTAIRLMYGPKANRSTMPAGMRRFTVPMRSGPPKAHV